MRQAYVGNGRYRRGQVVAWHCHNGIGVACLTATCVALCLFSGSTQSKSAALFYCVRNASYLCVVAIYSLASNLRLRWSLPGRRPALAPTLSTTISGTPGGTPPSILNLTTLATTISQLLANDSARRRPTTRRPRLFVVIATFVSRDLALPVLLLLTRSRDALHRHIRRSRHS